MQRFHVIAGNDIGDRGPERIRIGAGTAGRGGASNDQAAKVAAKRLC
jgi:hypothetical protein